MALPFKHIVSLTQKALPAQIRLNRDKKLAVILGNDLHARFSRMVITLGADVATSAVPLVAYGVASWQAADTWVRAALHLPPKAMKRRQTAQPKQRPAQTQQTPSDQPTTPAA
jgi:hypothetical protein